MGLISSKESWKDKCLLALDWKLNTSNCWSSSAWKEFSISDTSVICSTASYKSPSKGEYKWHKQMQPHYKIEQNVNIKLNCIIST